MLLLLARQIEEIMLYLLDMQIGEIMLYFLASANWKNNVIFAC